MCVCLRVCVKNFHLSRTRNQKEGAKNYRQRNWPEMRFKIGWLKRTFNPMIYIIMLCQCGFVPKQSGTFKSNVNIKLHCKHEHWPWNLCCILCFYYAFALNFSPFWHNSVDIVNSSVSFILILTKVFVFHLHQRKKNFKKVVYFERRKGISFLL